MTRTLTPNRASSAAMVRPTGPAPAIKIGGMRYPLCVSGRMFALRLPAETQVQLNRLAVRNLRLRMGRAIRGNRYIRMSPPLSGLERQFVSIGFSHSREPWDPDD